MSSGTEGQTVRQEYYGLLLRAFLSEPPEELLAFLAERAEPLAAAAAAANPTLAAGWQAVAEALEGRDLPSLTEAAREEFTRLFLGPVDPVVFPYQSYFESGQLLGDALVEVREFLGRAGLAPGEAYREPEDHVALEFEVMRRLIAKQAAAGDRDEATRWLNLQAAFLRRHLLPWVPRLCQALEGAPGAPLYRGLAKVTRGFLELEADLFADWPTPPEVPGLGEPRVRPWLGPTLDVGGPDPPGRVEG